MNKTVLPYFDELLSNLTKGNKALEESFGMHVHWGYWQQPSKWKCTSKDYHLAANHLTEKICSLANIDNNQTVLDVGCGFGGTLSYINNKYSDMNLIGVNIDIRQLKRAKTIVKKNEKNQINFINSNGCYLPLKDKRFENILAIECLFHFPCREKFFIDAYKALKPGGAITISDFIPHPVFLPSCWLASFKIFRRFNFFGPCNFTYTLKSYKKLAQKYNLTMKVVDISRNTVPTYDYLAHLAKSITLEKRYQLFVRLFLFNMKFLTWTRLLGYKIIKFEKNDD